MMPGENFFNAAYSYLYIRDFERASEAFARAIESDPENPMYYFHASVTALRNDCLDLALRWADTAFRLLPDNEIYREHLHVVTASILTKDAQLALVEGNDETAYRLFSEALQQDPLNEEAVRGLAMVRPMASEQQLDSPERNVVDV